MKQYCRYCAYLATGNGTWCAAHEREMSDSAAKRLNRCKDFDFNEIDAFFGNPNPYRPREPYRARHTEEVQGDQMNFFEKKGGEP